MHIQKSTAKFTKQPITGNPIERSLRGKSEPSAPTPTLDSATISKAVGDAVAEAVTSTSTESPIEGAQSIPGMFKVYTKDNKHFLSIKPDQLNKPFFFSSNVSKSVGEKRLVGSEMGDSYLAEFRRVDDQVQLVALHTENYAEPNTPQAKFVSEDYSNSLISSTGVMEGSTSEEILISADDLLLRDLSGYKARLNYVYESNFGLDGANTRFSQIDNHEEQTSFGVEAHFQAGQGAPGPSTTPLHNSVLTEFRYNFLQLPEEPMKPRLADERVGHFVTTRKDYTGDEGDGLVRMVNRWRLEKADPDAELSKPVEPITYWIANNVPKEYRKAVREGIKEWNKAFEAVGFKDAIKVRQQRSNDKFDTMDARHASVRWYTASDVGSAVGPSHVDPRTGEILDADIRMADVFGRGAKRFLADNPPATSAEHDHAHEHGHIHGDHGHTCSYQAHAAAEHEFAAKLLESRGDDKASKELAQAYVKDVVMHEVGHTLGLRHNFKGSTAFTAEQLQDANFTKENGLGSSVMDYHPYNLAGPGEKQGEYVMSTLGAYDYLAVQYAYAPIDGSKEAETLNEIAKKTTTDPLLAFETDEAADDMDPEVSRFDLGKNPLSFAEKQITLARELWDRAQTQELPEDTSFKEFTKAFSSGLSTVAGAARLANRYVGGVSIRRDRAGTGNPIYQPIAAETQREAVALITDTMFKPDSFKFDPNFVSRLAKNRFGSWGDQNYHAGEKVLGVQTGALRSLFDDDIAQRMISNPEKLPEDAPVYKLSELYQTVQGAIWSELPENKEASQARRNLQRAYIDVIGDKLSADSKAPGESKSMLRYLSGRLQKQIDASMHDEMSLEMRAHLEDCSQNLKQILNPENKS
jgi:uncharacterized protein DUF4953/uncharacterized protein DUF5117